MKRNQLAREQRLVPDYIEKALRAKPSKVTGVEGHHEMGCAFRRGGPCWCYVEVKEEKAL